ncbi:MAG: hypothetical protein LBG67_03335 [Campylobacteraceae bacterium]|nr:hypothetical protein [Campylobacteraceae bacterium]
MFNNVVFFQAYDEFGHIESDDEEYDDGVVIVKYTKSTLMNFIENSTGLELDLIRDKIPIHYCVRTQSEWFDILAPSDPIITKVETKMGKLKRLCKTFLQKK